MNPNEKPGTSEFLEITAAAAGGKHPKVSGVAYGGGKMTLWGWSKPVVVDLAGMTVPEEVPLLADHENHTLGRVGVVRAKPVDGHLAIEGEIVADGQVAEAIVNQAKAGADWQLSIGAEVESSELVQEGKRTVNGTEHEAPFYHITKSTLREVSVVAVGADRNTKMNVTATLNLTGQTPPSMKPEIPDMKDAKPVVVPDSDTKPVEAAMPPAPAPDPALAAQEAIKAERGRVAEIRKVCRGEFPAIEAKAVDEGWDLSRTTTAVLAAYREREPVTAPNVVVKAEARPDRKTLEAAVCLRAGISEEAVAKDYGEQVAEAAMPDRDLPLRGLLAECLRIEGKSVPRSMDNEAIKAAFSTVSLPGILGNVANKKLLQSYKAQPILATKLCSEGDLNDFKESDRFRLTDVGDLEPVAADGEIKEGGLKEEPARNQIDTYAKKFCLTRKMVINDDLGAFLKVPVAMGNRAARLIDQLFFRRLLANPVQTDGSPLFGRQHKNLLSGAASALGADSLKKAIQAYLDQVDADGQPISVEPKFLLVPTALKHQALELTRSAALIMSGGADNVVRPAVNVLADEDLEVVSSPYLANSKYPGFSETAWYLFGQPGVVDTFEIGYLKGKRAPTVERGDTDFNTLGIWFRVYFDVGCREQDHRGMVKATGTAG
jgi:hypothetical protein